MADEPSRKDIAFDRLESLYRGLSEEERYYVVSRWDIEQRLQPTHERLIYRNATPYRTRRRKFWGIAALIPVLLVCNWVGGLMRADRHRQEDSFVLDHLKKQSKNNLALKSAIEEANGAYQGMIEISRRDEW